jgi:ubiquinone biosynthesis monooxygenase Coq7
MLQSRFLRHLQSPRLRSFLHTRPPSSAYLDRTRRPDVSTSSTPDDLSPSQRRVLEAALRVDQAGEIAANHIYEGQLAVLRHDPVASALIQASSAPLLVPHHINLLC